jgi:transcriptional regulator with XRE-family HTH domain
VYARPCRPTWTVDVARLDMRRVLLGLSARQLATRARVDPDTVGDLLSQRRRPTLGTLSAICNQLDLTLHDVIQFSGGDRVGQHAERLDARQSRIDQGEERAFPEDERSTCEMT